MIKGDLEIKPIFLQIVFIVVIATLPIYLYWESSSLKQELQDQVILQKAFAEVSNEIYTAKNKQDLKKLSFDFFAYDNKSNIVFQNISNTLNTDSFCISKDLNKNLMEVKTLKVCVQKSSQDYTLKALLLFVFINIALLITLVSIIRKTTKPYKVLNSYLDDFLKDVMHEIKTPVGVAKLNVDLLAMRIEDSKYLLRIKSALKNMSVVYEDLEYYITQNTVKDEKIEIDLTHFLEKRCEFFKDLLNAKRMTLEKQFQSNISITFNEIELYRIIDNTISNAIKYSKNETTIQIFLYKKQNKIFFIVRDEGVGIEDTKKIFYRYYRGNNVNGGFGIGLSIVKKICDKNRVNIHVDSKLGKGSVFKYTFREF